MDLYCGVLCNFVLFRVRQAEDSRLINRLDGDTAGKTTFTQRSYCTVPDIVMFAVSCPQGKYGKSRAHKTSVDKTSQRCQRCLINSA